MSVVEVDGERAEVGVDLCDGAGLGGDGQPTEWGEGDDAITCSVPVAAGGDDLGAGEPATFVVGVAGELVECVDVDASPGDHDRVGPGVEVGEPAVEDCPDRFGPVGAGDDAVVGGEPVDGTVDAAVA